MLDILSFFLFVSLFYRTNTETGNVTKQENITSMRALENNLKQTPFKLTITTAKIVYDIPPGGKKEKNIPENKTTITNIPVNDIPINNLPINGTPVNGIPVNNIPLKNLIQNDIHNENKDPQHQRSSRLAKRPSFHGIECISCMGAGITPIDETCYSATSFGKSKCADAEACFTELHPQYIKRGCMLPLSLNRTFVCKCPLCNDKPAGDVTYYEYKTISDWQFDNERLEEPILGMELLCKVCETTGRSQVADKICANGSRADYMLCEHHQLCYTNINRQLHYVSRGCIDPPVYNSIFFFCNSSSCNARKYENPARIKRIQEIHLMEAKRRSSSATSMIITIKQIMMVLNLLVLF